MLDILIRNTIIVDGSGSPARVGNVGVKGDRIMSAADGDEAGTVIDGTGLYTCPGFIDIHSHGDLVLGQGFGRLCKISQGITTEIAGQCGSSMFPVDPKKLPLYETLLSVGAASYSPDMPNWTSFERYLKYAGNVPIVANIKMLVGHGCLRLAAMGYDCRVPQPPELEKMKELLREAMEHGAMGMSSGLIYTPSAYAQPAELAELAEVLLPYDGVYATHMRNESGNVLAAVDEALEIGRRTGVRVLISHHKVCGQENWGLSEQTLAHIDQAVLEGVRVTVDQYPYTASMTHLNACIPPWYFTEGIPAMAEKLKDPAVRKKLREEIENPDTAFDNYVRNCGGFSGVMISSCPVTHQAEGLFVTEYAEKLGKEPFDTFCDLLAENGGMGVGIYHCMSDEDLCRIIQNPNTVVGTDGICRAMEEKAHPRTFGSFPRAICHFHKEKKLFTLSEMIRKLTSLPAQRAMLQNKGLVREGYDADLLVFNYDTLKDTADYVRSNRVSEGIEYVIVNGRIVYRDKQLTGENPGRILLHNPRV